MRKMYKRLGAVLCALGMVLMLAAGLTVNVSAAEKSESLILYCKEDDFILSGMQWSIYKIGKKSGNKYTLSGDFANYPVILGGLTEESITETASTLENFAMLDSLSPERKGITDNNGVIRFENLEVGLYLACGKSVKREDYTFVPVPIIFEVDGSKKEIDGYPKFRIKRTLPGDIERYAVRKIWANADGVTDKPVEIAVEIYENNVVYDTVKLSQENNWTYSWEGDVSSEWRVKEVTVPAGCFVMYRNNTTQYIIMNNYDNELLRQTTTTTTVTTTHTVPMDTKSTSRTAVTTTRTGPIDGGEDTRTTTTGSKDVKPEDSTTFTGQSATVTTVSGDLTASSTDNDTSTSSTSDITISGTKTTTINESNNSSGGGNSNRTSKSTAKTTTKAIGKLPQTGQLWWPVPVMLFGGMIFVAIGLRLLFNSRRED